MDGSRDLKVSRTAEQAVFSHPAAGSESMPEGREQGRSRSSIDDQIQRSKCHWSETVKLKLSYAEDDDEGAVESDCDEEELARVKAENMKVFKALQSHPTWGGFFRVFDDDEGFDYCSASSLEVGEKFAEGGQAELHHAYIVWSDPKSTELTQGCGWVLKVFKNVTSLRHLQLQWPQGLLELAGERHERTRQGELQFIQYTGDVYCATLLDDDRFAFLLVREQGDLRTLIDDNMKMRNDQDCGPFGKILAEQIMDRVALGMDWLHGRNIVHRDLKASNVLYAKSERGYFIRDVRNQPYKRINRSASSSYSEQAVRQSYDSRLTNLRASN